MSSAFPIELKINWTIPEGDVAASYELAWGEGILYVKGLPVWFNGDSNDPKPIAWSWIELLEFLSCRWPWISGSHIYPDGLVPEDPFDIRRLAALKGDDYSDEEAFHFEGRHDLARGMHGISLPSILIVRKGDFACIAVEGSEEIYREKVSEVSIALQVIAETIVSRLALAIHSNRAKNAMSSWVNRRR